MGSACSSKSKPLVSETGKVVYFVRHGTAMHNVRYKQKDVVFKDLIEQRCANPADIGNRALFPEIEEWAYMTDETFDAELVESGIAEARVLGEAWEQGIAFLYDRHGQTETPVPCAMRDVELVVTSPLTRTLQTTMNVFFAAREEDDGVQRFVPRWCQTGSASGGVQEHPSTTRDPSMPLIPIVALDLVKEWSQGRHTPNKRKSKSELMQMFPQVDFSSLDSEADKMWKEYWPNADNGLEPRSHLEDRVARFKDWLRQRPEKHIVVVSHSSFLGNLLFGTFLEDAVSLAHCQLYIDRV